MFPPALWPLFLLGTMLAGSGLLTARPVITPDGPLAKHSGPFPDLLARETTTPGYERCTEERQIAMTFDDGPVRRLLPSLFLSSNRMALRWCAILCGRRS